MARSMGNCVIIPARGGSKGIPRKNLRLLAGKPLIAYSIEQAKRAPEVSRIVVSTDDSEIAEVAVRYGADAIARPSEISGDTATSESALLHVLDHLRQQEKQEPDLIIFLQATSPLRQPHDIQGAIETLQREQADSLFSACPVHGFVWRRQGQEMVSLNYDHLNRPRRQDAPEDLVENGSIYVFKPWVLRQFNNRLGGRIAVYRMRALDSFQIDGLGDLELFENLMALRSENQSFKPDTATEREASDVPPFGSQLPALRNIRLLVLDFDGVMTDNRVLVHQDGSEAVWCDRGDGLGIGLVKNAGIEVVVVSKEQNPVVSARCDKLGIDCIQGCDDKLAALRAFCASRTFAPAEVAYLGNDTNDVDCLRWVGAPLAVADARQAAKEVASRVISSKGGHGAVREVCDLLLKSAADSH